MSDGASLSRRHLAEADCCRRRDGNDALPDGLLPRRRRSARHVDRPLRRSRQSAGQTWLGATGHVGVMPVVGKELVRKFPPESVRPGDIFISNDPWVCNGQTADIFIFTPAFHRDRVIGFSVNSVHHVDIGGRKGSGLSEEVFEEGLIIPPDAPAPGRRAERGPAGHPHAQRPLQREGHGRYPCPGGRRLGGDRGARAHRPRSRAR